MRKDKPNLTYNDLKEKLDYITDSNELELIEKAYNFVSEKYFGEKRLTGEDYIIHPLNVAYTLTEIFADYATICAALLHSLIEDNKATNLELNELFGSEITSLLKG